MAWWGQEMKCGFCLEYGGAFKRAQDGRWFHVLCALAFPDAYFGDPERLQQLTVSKQLSARFNQV